MTGYHIRIGYNSHWNTDDAWRELVSAVERLRKDPAAILSEVSRVEGATAAKFDASTLESYAMAYAADSDLTLKVHETPDREVTQLASGGGDGREIKEKWRSRLEQRRKLLDAATESANRLAQWIDTTPLAASAIHDVYDAHVLMCELIRALSAAALPEGEETGWRDIASAPKDGTQVWVWPSYMPAYVEAGTGLWLYAGDDEAFYPQPTHWQPLRLRRTGP